MRKGPDAARGAASPPFVEQLESRTYCSSPSGSEFIINATTTNTQETVGPVSVAFNGSGEAVAVWESNQATLSTWGVFGRRFGTSGTPVAGEFSAGTAIPLNDQRSPSVARDAAGDFVVVWDAPTLGLLPSVFAQRFNAAGVAQGGMITVALGTVAQAKANASVAMDSTGRFAVAWESTNEDALFTTGSYARLYAADGTALAAEFLVNVTTAGDQVHPVPAFDSSGDLVVAWSGQGAGDTTGIFYRAFSPTGAALTGELAANTTIAGTQSLPSLAVAPNGTVVVVWSGAGSGDAAGIFARRISSAWAPIGGEISVNTDTTGTQTDPSVACDPDGDFVVAWSGQGTADADGIYIREFDASGAPRGVQKIVNQTTAGVQSAPSIAASSDNTYTVVWSGAGAGDADGVFGRALVDDPPLVTTTGGSLAYTENAGAVAVDPGIAVSDADSPRLSGATVAITGNYSVGEDVLAFVNQSGITGSWNAALGVLTLSGSATVAAYQSALATVTYTNTSDNPGTVPRTVSVVVSDGIVFSASASRGIAVTAVNDPPVVTTSGGSATYTEDGSSVAIDPGLLVSDPDSANLSGATVTISVNYAAAEDVLSFVNQSGITGLWNPVTGVLTLSGTASIASYRTALRSITYGDTSSNPSTLTRTVSFVVSDSVDSSSPATRVVTVTAVNDPPVVTTSVGSAAYTENAPGVLVDPLLLVTDPDSPALASASVSISSNYVLGQDLLSFVDQLGITGVWNSVTGVLTLSGAATLANYQAALRSITYSNSSDNPSILARTITFTVSDGAASSLPATRLVTVTAVNDPPVVTTSVGSAAYTENALGVSVDPLLLVTDPDNLTLASASVSISSNYVIGQDLLSFVNQSGITGLWNSVTGVLTLSGVASLANYQAALRSITYSNSSDNPSTLARTITFAVSDGAASSLPANRSVTVTAVNDPPVVTTSVGSAVYTENASGVPVDPLLLVADPDSLTLASASVSISSNYVLGQDLLSFVDQLGITGSWDPLAGTLTLSGTASLASYQAALRSISYTNISDNPSILTRTVTFVASDGAASSGAAARTVTVIAVNDRPVVTTSSGAAAFVENGPSAPVDPGLTVSDVDSPILAGATVSITGNFASQDFLSFTNQLGIVGIWNPVSGVLTLSGAASAAAYQTALRSVSYLSTSNNPSTLARTITFTVSDGAASSLPATRVVTVTGVNDPPVVTTSVGSAVYTENGAGAAVDPALLVSDVDNGSLAGTTVSISANYASGQDRLSFVDQSGITGLWNPATGVLTLSGVASLANYQAALRSITYSNSSENPGTLTRTVRFVVSDGTDLSAAATRSVAVLAVNDPPVVATSPGSAAYTEDGPPVAIDAGLLLSDPDNGSLAGASISISINYASGQDRLSFVDQSGIAGQWNPVTGVLTLSGTASLAAYQAALRSVTYANTSENPAALQRTIAFVVSDGAALSVPATRAVSVTPVNDAPVVTTSSGSAAYFEGGPPTAVDPGLVVFDADSPTLTGATVTISGNYAIAQDVLSFANHAGIVGLWNPLTGVLTLSGTATVAAYQDALRSVAYSNLSLSPLLLARTVSFVVSDGSALSAAATRTVQLSPADDAPVVITSPGDALYTENGPGVPVDPGLILFDADSPMLAGAVVSISANYSMGSDTLAFVDRLGISGTWNPSTGALTLSGIASVASYAAALRSVTYANSSDDPGVNIRTIGFAASDGLMTSDTAFRDVVVIAVDDRPTVTDSDGASSYVENTAATAVDPGVVIADPDSAFLSGATVRIFENHVPGEDALSFADELGITGSWDAATGTLTLTGIAPLASYQSALRSVGFLDASDNPSILPREISFVVSDGVSLSNTGVRELTVIAVNDAPTVQASPGIAAYTENGTASVVDPSLSVADVDSPTMVSATVTIAGHYERGHDVLLFTDQLGISGSWDEATGVLTLAGTASTADYQAALRSITYANSSDNPSVALRTVLFTVSDDIDSSSAAARALAVLAVDDAPVVTMASSALRYSTGGLSLVVDPSVTVADVDNVTLAGATITIGGAYRRGEDVLLITPPDGVRATWNPDTGVLTLSGQASVAAYETALRSVRYISSTSNLAAGSRTITMTALDGSSTGSAERSVVVEVNTTNDGTGGGGDGGTGSGGGGGIGGGGGTGGGGGGGGGDGTGGTGTGGTGGGGSGGGIAVVEGDGGPIGGGTTSGGALGGGDVPLGPTGGRGGSILGTNFQDVGVVRPLGSIVRSSEVRAAPNAPAVAPRTVQVLDLRARPSHFTSTVLGAGLGRQVTIAAMSAGGTLVVGYVVWLVVNYSLARQTLIVLPHFDPMDVHCLLKMAARRAAPRSSAA